MLHSFDSAARLPGSVPLPPGLSRRWRHRTRAVGWCLQAPWHGLCGHCPQGSPRLRLVRLLAKARTPQSIALSKRVPARSRSTGSWGPGLRPGLGKCEGSVWAVRSCRRCQGCSRWCGHLCCRQVSICEFSLARPWHQIRITSDCRVRAICLHCRALSPTLEGCTSVARSSGTNPETEQSTI